MTEKDKPSSLLSWIINDGMDKNVTYEASAFHLANLGWYYIAFRGWSA